MDYMDVLKLMYIICILYLYSRFFSIWTHGKTWATSLVNPRALFLGSILCRDTPKFADESDDLCLYRHGFRRTGIERKKPPMFFWEKWCPVRNGAIDRWFAFWYSGRCSRKTSQSLRNEFSKPGRNIYFRKCFRFFSGFFLFFFSSVPIFVDSKPPYGRLHGAPAEAEHQRPTDFSGGKFSGK